MRDGRGTPVVEVTLGFGELNLFISPVLTICMALLLYWESCEESGPQNSASNLLGTIIGSTRVHNLRDILPYREDPTIMLWS